MFQTIKLKEQIFPPAGVGVRHRAHQVAIGAGRGNRDRLAKPDALLWHRYGVDAPHYGARTPARRFRLLPERTRD